MLPNRMNLDKSTEDNLKRLKQYTGITPNVSARIAFFRSVESGFEYTPSEKKLDGSLVLDKITWLGETAFVTEQVLKMKYPSLETKDLMSAWASHVEDGIASIRNHKNTSEFADAISDK
ncbi:DNA sulfur modification protein DndE [Oleiphilus sp. HI0068]|nr:DNA sulfur modification protein DndE [Oleiphilus sp. HI0068]KZY75810.1 DNA sulfur modification protein DndE [Oleiphilus sp. HI0069]KZY77554.1 DNA sulfur modification protein DndE [Oleiphilus sp. HI0069]KZZ31713.1 DNA sulfur modification protein DndE [Oleiphilus sp. HI0085]